MQIELAAGNALSLHALQDIHLQVAVHINRTHEVVRVLGLQCLFQLCVTNVGLKGVVLVGVAMPHEGDGSLCHLRCIEGMQLVGHLRHVHVGVVQQRHTQEDGFVVGQFSQIGIVQVSTGYIAVVHKLLDACHDGGKLLTGNDLQRLHINLAVLGGTDSVQQVAWLVVVAPDHVAVVVRVLTNAGTVDADVAREAEIDISLGECLLVGRNGFVEGLEGIVPGRAESHQQDGHVLPGLGFLLCHLLVVDSILRDHVFFRCVVVAAATCGDDGGYHSQCHCSQKKRLNRFHHCCFVV